MTSSLSPFERKMIALIEEKALVIKDNVLRMFDIMKDGFLGQFKRIDEEVRTLKLQVKTQQTRIDALEAYIRRDMARRANRDIIEQRVSELETQMHEVHVMEYEHLKASVRGSCTSRPLLSQ